MIEAATAVAMPFLNRGGNQGTLGQISHTGSLRANRAERIDLCGCFGAAVAAFALEVIDASGRSSHDTCRP